MIGRLRGQAIAINDETLILDVNGVGYDVHLNERQRQSISAGEEITLAIETIVREDFIRLYGFASEAERQCFRLLTSVQGVGAKHAMNLLDVLSPAALYDAIALEDVTAVTKAHGIGRKLAQRIVTELKSKLSTLALQTVNSPNAKSSQNVSVVQAVPDGDARADTISALVNLGYEDSAARRAVAAAMAEEAANGGSVAALVPIALRHLSAS